MSAPVALLLQKVRQSRRLVASTLQASRAFVGVAPIDGSGLVIAPANGCHSAQPSPAESSETLGMLRHPLLRQNIDVPVRVNRKAHFSAHAVGGIVWVMAEGLAVLLVLLLGVVVVLDRAEVRLPFAAEILATRLSNTLVGQRFAIESVSFSLARQDRFAGITAHNVALISDDGSVLLSVPQVDVKFTMLDLVRGEIRPERVTFSGAEVFVRKTISGAFKLSLGRESAPIDAPVGSGNDLSNLVSGSEFLRNVPELAKLAEVAITGARVNYRDDAANRSWQVEAGKAVLRALPSGYSTSISGKLVQADGRGAIVNVQAKQDVVTGNSHVNVEFRDATPFDLADQFPALDWMRVLNAPVSGKLDLDVQADGTLLAFGGGLNIGTGSVVQAASTPAVFQAATMQFIYDPKSAIFNLSALDIDSAAFRMKSSGTVALGDFDARQVKTMVAQLNLREISVDPNGMFARPISFPDGRAALKVSLQPLSVSIGEIILFNGSHRWKAAGSVAPEAGRWSYMIDLQGLELSKDDLIAVWPLAIAPKARLWVEQNILAGRIARLVGSLRSDLPRPRFTLQFDYSDVSARFLKFMPVADRVQGYGMLNQQSFEINIIQGEVDVTGKGSVSAAGTRVFFPEYRLKPAPAIVDLVGAGDFPAVFDLINRAPLSLLDKGGFDPAAANGHALVRARLSFPVKKALQLSEIVAAADADLTEVSSDTLAAGRSLAAERLLFSARDGAMSIAGEARLDDLPVSFEWTHAYGPGAALGSALNGQIPISAEALASLGITLPKGSVEGQSTGQLHLIMQRGEVPEFSLDADLRPLALHIPALGWSKASGEGGMATVEGRLTTPITLGPVSIDAPGLKATGQLDLGNGAFRGVDFSTIAVGGWLDAALSYASGRARVEGGQIDLRRRGTGKSGGSTVVELNGTSIVVTDTISLADATGTIQSGRSLEGSLTARVNGGAAVEVALRPAEDGQRISVTGTDAGAILRDAGLFKNARGGDLRLTMVQTGGPGTYRGAFEIHNLRVKNAPVLAALLSAASIIGFLEQLDGKGLAFVTVSGSFTMADGVITLSKAKAVGASIGISLEGRYRPADKVFDMNGVISPLYAINGIFEKLPIIGRLLGGKDGEGLIGFSYLLRGSAAAPRVSVNPLSILTPGALREIFVPQRQPVPTQ